MTRLGFYIIHNNRYKLVKTVNVPWDFTIGGPDSDNPVVETPVIGEWQPQNLTYVVPVNDIVFKDDYQFVIKRFRMVLTENEEEEGITKETLYRVTYGDRKIGVYEALRLTISKEAWDNFLDDDRVSWLLVPPFEYKKGYRSFFTAEGYDRFKEETLPLISEYLDESAIKVETIEIIEQEAKEIVTDSSVLSKNEIESLLTALAEAEDEEEDYEDVIPKPVFEDWATEYFNDIIFNEKGFFDVFNTDRTYIVIAEEDPSVMGFMVVRKGRSYINFKEHDYRHIINSLHPAIRHDMAQIPDDSFGGYDDDDIFSQDKNKYDHSFGGFGGDDGFTVDSENKGIDTYPNLF